MLLSLLADFQRAVEGSANSHELLVDISDLYNTSPSIIKKACFTCTLAHRKSIEQQVRVLKEYPSMQDFWRLVSCQRRDKQCQNLVQLVRLGIPPQFRGIMWRLMTGTESRPLHFMAYADLFELGKQEEAVEHIMRDAPRTYAMLNQPGFTRAMERILIAYSIRNPKLGYCQAMNFLAATLLIFMEEEHAFWALVHVVEEVLPNYYIPSLSGFITDTRVFEQLLSENLPDLYKHFKTLNLGINILTAPWFLCMFTKDFPAETAFVIWDNLMLDGIVALFEVGLAILRMLQSELLEFDDQSELILFIRESTAKLYNPALLRTHWVKLDKQNILCLRKTKRCAVEEEAQLLQMNEQLKKLEQTTHFSSADLTLIYRQYKVLDPFIHYNPSGLDFEHFSQFVAGTFKEWRVDHDLVGRLFELADANGDGFIDFSELASLLSVICRGTPLEVRDFCFKLFDVSSKGHINKADLHRMFQSLFVMFKCDNTFRALVQFFVDSILEHFGNGSLYKIYIEQFEYVVSQIPRIFEQLKERSPKAKYTPQSTLYYWLFGNKSNQAHSELIRFSLDKQALLTHSKAITTN